MKASALVFACHSKACAPPPTGTGGSKPSSGSGSVALAQARKEILADGAINDKFVSFTASKAIPGLVLLRNQEGNTVLSIKGEKSGEWLYAYRLGGSDIVSNSRIHEMLTALDHAQSLQPLPSKPRLFLGDFTNALGTEPSGMAKGITIIPPNAGGFVLLSTQASFVTDRMNQAGVPEVTNANIYINTSSITARHINNDGANLEPNFNVPSASVNYGKYLVNHEFGHLRLQQGLDAHYDIAETFEHISTRNISGMSKYGMLNRMEAHAEAFAEWVATGGQPEGLAIQVMAHNLSWANTTRGYRQFAGRVFAMEDDDDMELPVILIDTPDGPIHVMKDGTRKEFGKSDD